MERVIDAILNIHQSENFKYELSNEELTILAKMSTKQFLKISKDFPVSFTKRFFSIKTSDFLEVPDTEIVDYLKQFHKQEIIDKRFLLSIDKKRVPYQNKFVVLYSMAFGEIDDSFLDYIVPCKEYPFALNSELHRAFINMNDEQKFFDLVKTYIQQVINNSIFCGGYDTFEFISNDVLDKIGKILVTPRTSGSIFLIESKKLFKREFCEHLLVSSEYIKQENEEYEESEVESQSIIVEQILSMQKYKNQLKSIGIDSEELNLEIPDRETIENLKKEQNWRKEEIEEIYQSMLPKQKVKQAKMNL